MLLVSNVLVFYTKAKKHYLCLLAGLISTGTGLLSSTGRLDIVVPEEWEKGSEKSQTGLNCILGIKTTWGDQVVDPKAVDHRG